MSCFFPGAPFSSDYALVKYTDTSNTAMRSVKYMGFTASSDAKIDYGTNCVLLNTQIGVGANPFVQIQPNAINLNQQAIQAQFNPALSQAPQYSAFNPQASAFNTQYSAFNTQAGAFNPQSQLNLNQIQPQFNFGSMLGRSPSSAMPKDDGIQILEPNSIPGMAQEVPPGAKPWLLDPNGARPMEWEIATEPQETIIQPVLRNQYLTKLKRLLPTFFEDFDGADINAILVGQEEEAKTEAKEYDKEVTDETVPEPVYQPEYPDYSSATLDSY